MDRRGSESFWIGALRNAEASRGRVGPADGPGAIPLLCSLFSTFPLSHQPIHLRSKFGRSVGKVIIRC